MVEDYGLKLAAEEILKEIYVDHPLPAKRRQKYDTYSFNISILA
jgi:hypothetical protein